MDVYLATFGDHLVDEPARLFAELASQSAHRAHRVTSDPGAADIILFTQPHMLLQDWRLASIRAHDLFNAFSEKVMVYDERDRPWCAFPGVYVSMPSQSFCKSLQRAGGYYRIPTDFAPTDQEPDLLFSFIGSPSAPCRRPLFELRYSDAIVECIDHFTFFDANSRAFDTRRHRFQDVLRRSRFVLCPRGRGTSSIRLYETLATGRVPVIISDQWVPPRGPAWDEFSIRWPEHRTSGLLDLLLDHDREWSSMSTRARHAYDTFFSPRSSFTYVVGLCESIRSAPHPPGVGKPVRNRAYWQSGYHAYRTRLIRSTRRAGKHIVTRVRRPTRASRHG